MYNSKTIIDNRLKSLKQKRVRTAQHSRKYRQLSKQDSVIGKEMRINDPKSNNKKVSANDNVRIF